VGLFVEHEVDTRRDVEVEGGDEVALAVFARSHGMDVARSTPVDNGARALRGAADPSFTQRDFSPRRMSRDRGRLPSYLGID
jgi:hypothetical protein